MEDTPYEGWAPKVCDDTTLRRVTKKEMHDARKKESSLELGGLAVIVNIQGKVRDPCF